MCKKTELKSRWTVPLNVQSQKFSDLAENAAIDFINTWKFLMFSCTFILAPGNTHPLLVGGVIFADAFYGGGGYEKGEDLKEKGTG
jgi:hypothetical protein